MVAGPRLFTTASVRGILHNPFYSGMVRHKDSRTPGLHEALVSDEVFRAVQVTLRRNSGRSETLHPRPEREYLLKGLIRCAYCRMPMWAQTYNSGRSYYREHKGSRGAGNCVNRSGSITCHIPDEQMGQIMSAIVLPEAWLDRVLARIQLADEVKRVEQERKDVEQRL
jgi:site-specific DNA recombinase